MIHDAVIVGAGISGSFIGNALTQAGASRSSKPM